MPQRRRPKLGQHFLTDARYRKRIAETLDLRPDDLVVEIGPGRGAMIELLAERAGHLVALELDALLAEKLAKKLRSNRGVEVLQADILTTDLGALCRRYATQKCFVFGNIPYYITSPILHHLFRFRGSIRAMALVMQREVAERLTAAPGSRAYGYLTILTHLYSQPRIMLYIPPGAFSPSPKVQSALVGFQLRAKFSGWCFEDEQRFLEFVTRCLARKRRTLLNNLGKIYSRQRVELALENLGLPPTIRAEQLTMEQLASVLRCLA